MADYLTTDTELTSVANAIRTKGGTSAQLVYPTGFVSAIEGISTGTDVSDTTATAGDVLSGKYFYTSAGTKTQGSIASKSSSNLTVSGATVTAPAGYYSSAASKSVASGSATTPATTITANPSITVNSSGLITATASATKSVTPTVGAGYVSSGTAGTITVSGSNTSQLTTQAAQTITPTTTNQTIASGKYLTGAQTIKGDANLVAANIAQGVTIFGVQGTHSGGGAAEPNDVNFYDYDGTIVYSYSASDFANLSALPANPSHDGLTAQGWNWTLSDAKTYVASYGKLNVGQMYITTDGKTHIHIHLEQGRTSPRLACCPNGTVDVDWGDGTTHDTLTGTSTSETLWTTNHSYAAPGDYVIKLTVTGSMSIGSGGPIVFTQYAYGAAPLDYVYKNSIKSVHIGSGVATIGEYAFEKCYSLSKITIPSSVTSLGFQYVFYSCYSLSSITIPSSVSNIPENAFRECYSLASVSLPKSANSLQYYAFYDCHSLSSITMSPSSGGAIIYSSVFAKCYSLSSVIVPSGLYFGGANDFFNNCYSLSGNITITFEYTAIPSSLFMNCYSLSSITILGSNISSIGSNAFNNCKGLSELHFKVSSPPPVSNSNTFSGIPTDCKIYVPTGSLSAYTSATNYPSSSKYTYIEE